MATLHGHCRRDWRSKEYDAWRSMKKRCSNPNEREYMNYGGRGITVCERWHKFEHFLADMGPAPIGTSLGRIDNNKGYQPDNCRWETPDQQRRNTRNNWFITFDGMTMCLRDWERHLGLSYNTLRYRLERGTPLAIAMTSGNLPRGWRRTLEEA